MKLKRLIIASMFVVATAGIAGSIVAHAAPTADSELTQEITAGALSTDIRDASGNVVVNPSFAMSSQTVSNAQQTSTGTFGDNARRVTVDNPGGANGGWTLSWNASTPGTGTWTSGTDTYAYNGDATTGQLTVNPATGTLVSSVGSSTGITLAWYVCAI